MTVKLKIVAKIILSIILSYLLISFLFSLYSYRLIRESVDQQYSPEAFYANAVSKELFDSLDYKTINDPTVFSEGDYYKEECTFPITIVSMNKVNSFYTYTYLSMNDQDQAICGALDIPVMITYERYGFRWKIVSVKELP